MPLTIKHFRECPVGTRIVLKRDPLSGEKIGLMPAPTDGEENRACHKDKQTSSQAIENTLLRNEFLRVLHFVAEKSFIERGYQAAKAKRPKLGQKGAPWGTADFTLVLEEIESVYAACNTALIDEYLTPHSTPGICRDTPGNAQTDRDSLSFEFYFLDWCGEDHFKHIEREDIHDPELRAMVRREIENDSLFRGFQLSKDSIFRATDKAIHTFNEMKQRRNGVQSRD